MVYVSKKQVDRSYLCCSSIFNVVERIFIIVQLKNIVDQKFKYILHHLLRRPSYLKLTSLLECHGDILKEKYHLWGTLLFQIFLEKH